MKRTFLYALSLFGLGASRVHAQTVEAPFEPPADSSASGSGGLVNPLNNIDSLPDLLTAILDAVVQLGAIILVIAIVYVGFKFVVAQGNEERIKEARGALVWTVIGGLILLGAQAISLVIQQTVSAL